jgi:hypothetical protein
MSVRSYSGGSPHEGALLHDNAQLLLDDKTLCTQNESSMPALQKKVTITLNQYNQRKWWNGAEPGPFCPSLMFGIQCILMN